MCRPIVWLLLLLSYPPVPVSAQDAFSGVGQDYVPEGKPTRRSGISTVKQCQAACAAKDDCKAYAFRRSKPACYFYSEVRMGGPMPGVIYSSGLAVVLKSGFVSAFKKSSFPPQPIPIQPAK
jgi:hypothetical protein